MYKTAYQIISIILLFTACDGENMTTTESEIPTVKTESTYSILVDEDVIYAEGLSHNDTSTSPFSTPLELDVYYPDNDLSNRPIFMFIHGGGFQGGTKTKPEIVSMANYYASRGWVFASIDYRTTAKLGTIEGKSPEDISMFYKGIAPQEWIDFTLQNASSSDEIQTSIAMYAAQRDAKAALRWILANSTTYGVDTDFITVGGASAGAISAIALGISNQENFRDEISTDEDVTLSTTNLNESYTVKSMVYFWGSNIKLELLEAIYGINPYDSSDPELFMAHGTMDANPTTTFSEATELDIIYDSTGVYSQLIPLEGKGHGAWATLVNGKSLSDLSFDFIVERQGLNVE